MELHNKRIVLGITGGIAAYKAAELARAYVKEGAQVQVVMTPAATQFITPLTLQALSGKPVFVDAWDNRIANHMPHIELSRDADLIVIAPASTDFMAKLAQGRGDDLLSNLCLARECPLLLAPAMNRQMWQNPATQRNVQHLMRDGITLLGPDAGDQACGETGLGRMLEPAALLAETVAFFQPKILRGKRVLITAGPTFEAIDPVRGITNLSSGKMGYAIAQAAQEAGAQVHLVSGPTALPVPLHVTCTQVQSAQQMLQAVLQNVSPDKKNLAQQSIDIFIAVAAVADWRVKNVSSSKLKKSAEHATPILEFEQNPDILATVARLSPAPYCVGFAAESESLEAYARNKLQSKNIDLIVGNLAQSALGANDNEMLIIDAHSCQKTARASKLTLARQLVQEIARRIH